MLRLNAGGAAALSSGCGWELGPSQRWWPKCSQGPNGAWGTVTSEALPVCTAEAEFGAAPECAPAAAVPAAPGLEELTEGLRFGYGQ